MIFKLKFILVLILLYVGKIYAQITNPKILLVIDSSTRKPIPMATLSVNQKKYYSTDETGKFDINLAALHKGDTVRVSSIGFNYKNYIFTSKESFPSILALSLSSILLDEILIKHKKPKEITVGSNSRSLFGYTTYLNSKYARYFPNTNNVQGKLKEVEIQLSNVAEGIDKPLKISILSKSSGIDPGPPLITDDIVVTNQDKKNQVTVNLLKYNIDVPVDGFFIVVETLSREYYDSGLIYKWGATWNKLPGLFWIRKKDIEGYCLSAISGSTKWYRYTDLYFSFRVKLILMHTNSKIL